MILRPPTPPRRPVDMCSRTVNLNSHNPRYTASFAYLSSSLQKLALQPERSCLDGSEHVNALAIAQASAAIEERRQAPKAPLYDPQALPPALFPLVRKMVRRARRVGALGDERHVCREVLLSRNVGLLRREIVRALRANVLILKKIRGYPYSRPLRLRRPCRFLKGNRVAVGSFVNASFNAVVCDVGGFPAPLLCERLKRPNLRDWDDEMAEGEGVDCGSDQEDADDDVQVESEASGSEVEGGEDGDEEKMDEEDWESDQEDSDDDGQIESEGSESEVEGGDDGDEGEMDVEKCESDDVNASGEEAEGDREDDQDEHNM